MGDPGGDALDAELVDEDDVEVVDGGHDTGQEHGPRPKPDWWRPPSGTPASGIPARGGDANGSWQPFTAGPDGTAVEASKTSQELGRQRKEAARAVFNEVHANTAAIAAQVQRQAIEEIRDDFAAGKITGRQAMELMQQFERTLDRLLGKPTQHTEGTHEVNIAQRLKQKAAIPLPEESGT